MKKKIVVPQVWLGKDVKYTRGRKDNALTAAEYHTKMQLPTLAELRHAFFGKNLDGSFVSDDYRQSVLSKRGYGEWTSTFLQDGKLVIERPERVFCYEKHGLRIAEGGKVTKVELPPVGWTLEYDNPTGFPSRTSQKREDAEKVFGDDTSYFYYSDNGLRAVLRCFDRSDIGPFYVDADFVPDSWGWGFGGRECRRSE